MKFNTLLQHVLDLMAFLEIPEEDIDNNEIVIQFMKDPKLAYCISGYLVGLLGKDLSLLSLVENFNELPSKQKNLLFFNLRLKVKKGLTLH